MMAFHSAVNVTEVRSTESKTRGVHDVAACFMTDRRYARLATLFDGPATEGLGAQRMAAVHRATPASCLCMSAAGSLAASFDSLTKLSQCTAACAIFVLRKYVFAVAACSLASAVYCFANVRALSESTVFEEVPVARAVSSFRSAPLPLRLLRSGPRRWQAAAAPDASFGVRASSRSSVADFVVEIRERRARSCRSQDCGLGC